MCRVSVYALVPARVGSKGIARKNWRVLGDRCLWEHAVRCAEQSGCDRVVCSSDSDETRVLFLSDGRPFDWLYAPAPLHTDECPMIDVVKDALHRVPGAPDDIWVLLQPTQPLRTAKHVKAAIALLQEWDMDSVVSVVALPRTHSPDVAFRISGNRYLMPPWKFRTLPARRQDIEPWYIRDGTVYAFYRRTVEQHGNIYGQNVRPLIIPPEETCELDTIQDWEALEQRWKERIHAVSE